MQAVPSKSAFLWDDPKKNSDSRSLGTRCIKGTDASTLGKEFSVSLMHPQGMHLEVSRAARFSHARQPSGEWGKSAAHFSVNRCVQNFPLLHQREIRIGPLTMDHCHIFVVDDKDDVAFAVDFKHLSPQMGNIEPKQLRAETCGRSSPIGQGCYGCATNWFRQQLCPLN